MKLFFDLHLHSCLSPCGDDDMTPANLAAMCALAGLDIAALTDHNSTRNCPAFCEAAARNGLLAVPGMELTTREEVHVVCLFPDLSAAEAFCAYVYARLPGYANNRALFGPQIVMDAQDGVLDEETRPLAAAADIGLYEVAGLIARYGGIAYPAHIDRPSFSVLSNLGVWDPGMGFSLAELSHNCPAGLTKRPDLTGLRFVTASDAHMLEQVRTAAQIMDIPEKTIASVLTWLGQKWAISC